ncbi:MAG: hypothetical protein BV457_00540 [Thermoplasmata archaeon M9B1D]|nr:MAG: hypothetical protein BV457_00540 [Thermoplasmata archaeon M9B1D]PNX52161.1 MAG: hypothetical protein BV456_00315 [Thermoplasmata archaeon M8B2D]
MALRKEKKNKLAIKPTKKLGDITVRRPYDLWADMDRMFDDFRTQFNDLLLPWSQRDELTTYAIDRTPLMDIADLGDKYEMRVEMPGIPKEDIEIEVTPTSIEICAEHEDGKEDKDKNWLRRERNSMSYYRSLELPEQIKSDNVDAEFRDGILTVMLPKVEPKPKHKASKVKIK